MSEKYNNSGSIFRNDKKAENPSRPDYTGSATIDGVDYWISCWVKQSNTTGAKFFSCTYRRKDNQPAATQPATELEKPIFPDTGEELPF